MSPAAAATKKQNAAKHAKPTSKTAELDEFEKLLSQSAKQTRELFSTAYSQAVMDEQARFVVVSKQYGSSSLRISYLCSFDSQRIKLTTKIHDEYDGVRKLPEALIKQQNEAKKNAQKRAADQAALAKKTTLEEAGEDADAEESNSSVQQLIDSIPEKSNGYATIAHYVTSF